jgi:hypothetical protein
VVPGDPALLGPGLAALLADRHELDRLAARARSAASDLRWDRIAGRLEHEFAASLVPGGALLRAA